MVEQPEPDPAATGFGTIGDSKGGDCAYAYMHTGYYAYMHDRSHMQNLDSDNGEGGYCAYSYMRTR